MHSKSMTIGFPIRFVLLSFERLGFNLKSIRSTRHHWQVYNNAFKEVVQNSVARIIRVFPLLHPSPLLVAKPTLLPCLPLVALIAVPNNMTACTHHHGFIQFIFTGCCNRYAFLQSCYRVVPRLDSHVCLCRDCIISGSVLLGHCMSPRFWKLFLFATILC